MKKQLLPFVVITLLSLTACGNDGYIKCKNIETSKRTYVSSEATTTLVFAYKAEDVSSKPFGVYGDKNLVYVQYTCSEQEAKKGISVPSAGYFHYGLSNLNELILKYDSEMGRYSSHESVYYSPSKKSIKCENSVNKPIQGNKSKELNDKAIFFFTIKNTDSGDKQLEVNILSNNYNSYSVFSSSTDITFIDVGNETVAYVPYNA